MKIILSRKGIDSSYGGGASPILPNGDFVSIPIPASRGKLGVKYSELKLSKSCSNQSIFSLFRKIKLEDYCHLDPDLNINNVRRIKNWLPAFGQAGGAATHLKNEHIEKDDLFLFYGSFRKTELCAEGKLIYQKGSQIEHVIYAYLQIGEILEDNNKHKHQWLENHPHVINDYSNNLIFIANKKLSFNPNANGAGILKYNPDLILTKKNETKSIWELPLYFHPSHGTEMTRHKNSDRWTLLNDKVILRTVPIGQEFVICPNDTIVDWAISLINENNV